MIEIVLAILWLLSPLAFIPLLIFSIILWKKKTRLENFISELYRTGRISRKEYTELKAEEKDASSAPRSLSSDAPIFSDSHEYSKKTAEPVCRQTVQQAVQPPKPVQPQTNTSPSRAETGAVSEAKREFPEMPSRPVFRDEDSANTSKQSAPPRAAEAGNYSSAVKDDLSACKNNSSAGKRAGAMSAVMTIGVIFVILAGLVFSTAVWVNLGNFGRTCVIGAVSALFFGISAFAKKALRLESTAFAFYSLGTFFTAITFITAGFFGLMGSFLSVGGSGSCALLAIAAMMICILSAKGRSIFNRAAAAYISVFSGAAAAVLLLVQLSDETGIFPLLMSLLTLAVNTFVYTLESEIPEKWEKPVTAASAVLYALSLLSGISAVFGDRTIFCICAAIYAARSVLIAVMGFKGHSIYREKIPAAVSLLSGIFFSAGLIWKLSCSLEVFALVITASSFIFSLGFFARNVKIPPEWEGSVKLSAFLLSAAGIISSLAALAENSFFGSWNGICFAIAGLHIVCSFAVGIMAVYGHNVYGRASSAFSSLFTGMVFSLLLISELTHTAEAAALCLTALFLVFANAVYSASPRLPEGWKTAVNAAASVLGIISVAYSFIMLCGTSGSWNAVCFVIAALYIIQSTAVIAMAYKGHRIYGERVFGVLSQLIGIAFTVMTLSELALSDIRFALLMTVFAVLYINFVYSFKLPKPDEWKKPLDISALFLITASILISGYHLISLFGEWTYECFAIAAIYIIQSAAVTVMAYRGHKTYGRTVFGVLSQLIGIAFTVTTLSELAMSDIRFALLMTVFAVLYINFVYTFRLPKPDEWKMPLDISAAFLTAASILISGYHLISLFGEWTYECFAIAAIYIIQSAAVTAMAFTGHSEYIKSHWAALSQLTGLSFTVMLFWELAPDGNCFILLLALLAALYTAASGFAFLKAPEEWLSASKAAEIVLNTIAAFASAGMLIEYNGNWNVYCFITAALYIIITCVWGIRLKNSLLKAAECFIGVLALYNIYCIIEDIWSIDVSGAPLFILVVMLFAYALAHHFAKPVRTAFSDIFLTFSVVMTALFLGSEPNILGFGIFGLSGYVPAIALLLIKSSEKERRSAAVYSVFLPLPVTGMVFTAMEMLFAHAYLPFVYKAAAASAVLAVIAAAVLITKKHSGAAFYSFAAVSAVMALSGLFDASLVPVGIQLLFLAVTVLLTVLFGLSSNNLPSLLTMAGSALAAGNIAYMTEPTGSNAVHILTAALFSAVCLAASRVFFPKKLFDKENGRLRADTCCIGLLLSIPMLDGLSGKAGLFAVLTLLALFAADLARKEHNGDFNRAALTAGCALFTAALINRPFLIVSDPLFSVKITLGLICIFGYVFSKLWRKYPSLSENFSSAVYSFSFICLIIEALTHENLFNTLIVLGVSLAILLYSFIRKKKRWFAVSSIALTGLTLYIFRDFFHMIDWWVYLLAVGLLLIAVSSANEYFIKKGRELKEKAGRFFEDWTW